MTARLDHLAVVARCLDEGRGAVQAALGVPLEPGGRHDLYRTENALLDLGDLYLEVIAPSPGAPPGRPRWFGLDHLAGPPRLGNWICAVDDLDAWLAGAPLAGQAVDLERGDLRWRIGVPADGSLPMAGGFPTLIEWARGQAHPATRLPDRGCRLGRLRVSHPEADRIAERLGLEDPRVLLLAGPAGLTAEIDTPSGRVILA